MRLVLAALAALATTASALKTSDCENVATAATVAYDTTKACYTGTFPAGGAVTINVAVPAAMDAKNVDFILWNAAQSTSFTASVQYRDTAGAVSGVSATSALSAATGGSQIPFIYRRAITAVRQGPHAFVVTGGTAGQTWAFVVDSTGTVVNTATVGSTTGATYSVLATATQAQVAVTGGFVDEQVIVKSATAVATSTSTSAASIPSAATFSSRSVNTAATTASTTGAATTFTFQRLSRPTKGAATLSLSLGNIASTYYDWATNGPYFTGSVTFANPTYYPKITASTATAMTVTASGRAASDNDVVELTVEPLWWNVTIDAPTTDSSNAATGPPNVYIASDPSNDLFATGSAWSTKAGNSLAGASLTFENGNIRISAAAGSITAITPSTAQEVAPVSPTSPPRLFIRIARRAGQPTTGLLTSSVTYTTRNISGSCQSYADCYATEDKHPSLRFLLSADATAARLRRCLLVPSTDDPFRPTAQCSECIADCDCGTGQYCHKDPGMCTDGAGNPYVCDVVSNARFGLCVAKDPTGSIIGSGCRANTGAVFSAATTSIGRASLNSVALVSNEPTTADDITSVRTGHGFCGGAAYYNSSNLDGPSSTDMARAGVARTILWTGSCIDGVCHECASSSTDCDGAVTCIQGRRMATVVVDNTVRTFDVNTVAGTMLGATCMIILAIAIVLGDCICRHQWREEDIKQRKLNYERRHKKKHAPAVTSAPTETEDA